MANYQSNLGALAILPSNGAASRRPPRLDGHGGARCRPVPEGEKREGGSAAGRRFQLRFHRYDGHFQSVCYHPLFLFNEHALFLFNEHADCLAAKLRPGNMHSADEWYKLLLPEIERQEAKGKRVAFRADAAFAKPEIYTRLEGGVTMQKLIGLGALWACLLVAVPGPDHGRGFDGDGL